MENGSEKLIAVGAQDGPTVSVLGDTYRLIVTGQQTGGNYAIIDMLVPPGGGPGPHRHPDFHESFYVLDGEIRVQLESESFTAQKGQFVSIPKGGGVHRFRNESNTTAHLLCTVVPAGLDDLFLEIGRPVAPGEFLPPPQMEPDEQERLKAIVERHGQTLYPPDYFDT